jgi:hypothetical protein
MKIAFAFFFSLSFFGCVTPASQEALNIKEADENMIEDCTFKGEVRGQSHFGGKLGAETGISNAKDEARERAATKRATHIVWKSEVIADKDRPTSVVGRAYLCEDEE